jgi:hypothetical protein
MFFDLPNPELFVLKPFKKPFSSAFHGEILYEQIFANS